MFSLKSAAAYQGSGAVSVLSVAQCFRNHTKDHVGHFSHAEKKTQARLDELHMERKLRAYRAKG